eukprot:scaffold14163_cov115-Isochrysis_galbana.AAC.10
MDPPKGWAACWSLFNIFERAKESPLRDRCAAMAFAGRCCPGVLVGVFARTAPHRYRSFGSRVGVNGSRHSRRPP